MPIVLLRRSHVALMLLAGLTTVWPASARAAPPAPATAAPPAPATTAPPAPDSAAAPAPATKVPPAQVFYIGHSLVNFDVPWMVRLLAAAAGLKHTYKQQLLVGASLKMQWNDHKKYQRLTMDYREHGADAREELPRGGYDALILCEALPLRAQIESGAVEHGKKFYRLATEARPTAAVHLYETWAYRPPDDEGFKKWRAQLVLDRPVWEKLARDIGQGEKGQPVRIIPAGFAMERLYDALAKGPVGSLKAIKDVFNDDVHLNDLGNYYVALVVFSSVYGRDPRGLKPELKNPWSAPYKGMPDAQTLAQLQELAFTAVESYRQARGPGAQQK